MTTMDTGGKGNSILDVPEVDALHLDERPDGPGAAAMMAAGIGILVLGLFTLLSEASVPRLARIAGVRARGRTARGQDDPQHRWLLRVVDCPGDCVAH
jgi:hypothetical protein